MENEATIDLTKSISLLKEIKITKEFKHNDNDLSIKCLIFFNGKEIGYIQKEHSSHSGTKFVFKRNNDLNYDFYCSCKSIDEAIVDMKMKIEALIEFIKLWE